MATLTEKIKALVEAELGPLRIKRDKLQAELDAVNTEIAAAENAVPSLRKTVSKKKGVVRKPSPQLAKVTGIMTGLLEQNKDLSQDDLYELVKTKLAEEGFLLTGLSKRFEKILAENDRFIVSGDKINIKEV